MLTHIRDLPNSISHARGEIQFRISKETSVQSVFQFEKKKRMEDDNEEEWNLPRVYRYRSFLEIFARRLLFSLAQTSIK